MEREENVLQTGEMSWTEGGTRNVHGRHRKQGSE